jgi:hypothetical protein
MAWVVLSGRLHAREVTCCGVQCSHCTEWNSFPEFESVEIFVCDYSGEPVGVDETVQREQMSECDQRLQALMAELPARKMEAAGVAVEAAGTPPRKKRSHGKPKNAPRFDLHAELERVCGVDR